MTLSKFLKLYKHYKNKRDIFDSIINRMDELDYERAREYNMPEGNMDEIIKGYRKISIDKIRIYTEVQFKHWTEEEFPSLFRRNPIWVSMIRSSRLPYSTTVRTTL